jgi:hypothetical protein
MSGQGDIQQPGEQTRDLREVALGNPEAHEHELETQRRGSRYLAGGLGTLVGTLLVSLGISVVYNDTPFPDSDAKIFATLVFGILIFIGASMFTVGLAERSERDNRARQLAGAAIAYDRGQQAVILLQREILDRREQHSEIRRQYDEVREQNTVVMGILSAVVGRLDAIENVIDKVPAYGAGVIQGITLGRDSAAPEHH